MRFISRIDTHTKRKCDNSNETVTQFKNIEIKQNRDYKSLNCVWQRVQLVKREKETGVGERNFLQTIYVIFFSLSLDKSFEILYTLVKIYMSIYNSP